MGADLMTVSYIRYRPHADVDWLAADALMRSIIGAAPAENLVHLINDYTGLVATDDDEDALRAETLEWVLAGLNEVNAGYSSRHHSCVAINGYTELWVAGGTTWGDDPFDCWTAFCVFLDLLGWKANSHLREAIGIDPNVSSYLVAGSVSVS